MMSCFIFMFILFYIWTFYKIVSKGIKAFSSTMEVVMVAMMYIAMLFSITLLIKVKRSAQNLQNNSDKLSRSLERLNLQLCLQADNIKQKELRQLLHVVVNRPISIKAFGAGNVNMTLVPACFAFIMSYTVVALQFNNIV